MEDNTQTKYPLSIRILHWLIAFIILCLIAVGLIMVRLPHDDPSRPLLFGLHKSFGITILALGLLRLFLRLKVGVPELPAAIPRHEREAAQLGHWAFYGFMFLMPVSGYLMSTYFGLPVKWFGLALPRLVGVDKMQGEFFADVHTYAAYALMGLIVLHVAGVAWHYFREKINLLTRMW